MIPQAYTVCQALISYINQHVTNQHKKTFDKHCIFSLLLHMSVLTAAKRTEIEAELAALEAELVLLNAAYASVLASGMKSYKFDSGEGSQSATYMSVKDIKENIDLTRSQIASKKRVLTGGHMRRINLNRKPTYTGFW